MSPNEAASLLQVTPRRVRQLIAAGKLRATKRGGQWQIAADDLDGYTSGKSAALEWTPDQIAAFKRRHKIGDHH